MKKLLSSLPKVDEFLKDGILEDIKEDTPYKVLLKSIRRAIEIYRNAILEKEITDETLTKEKLKGLIEEKIYQIVERTNPINLKKVINGTGTIIHTNLGRSKLSEKSVSNIFNIANSYNNLEYDLKTGKRGSRYSHIEDLICEITGAEGALVVNNNAAAVLLVLETLTKGMEVVVSRGELVEIGGSFRIPAIMELGGSKLVEVGTTNRTHIEDYERAIGEETKALLKVHTSNYKIMGFTKEVKNKELCEIGRKHNILSIEDLGSGVLVDFSKYGYKKEPTVQESLRSGMDIVTFSGDKLLGGPQAGIIVGRKDLIQKMKKNNLLRTLRVSKLTLAALEVTLKEYLDEKEAIKNIPTLKMILEEKKEVLKRAELLKEKLSSFENLEVEVVDTKAMIGGGSMPTEVMDSYGISIISDKASSTKLEKKLRLHKKLGIIGRVQNDTYVLDCKTIVEEEMDGIYEVLKDVIK